MKLYVSIVKGELSDQQKKCTIGLSGENLKFKTCQESQTQYKNNVLIMYF